MSLLFLWFFVCAPLVFVGSYFGFRAETYTIPVRVNQIARCDVAVGTTSSAVPTVSHPIASQPVASCRVVLCRRLVRTRARGSAPLISSGKGGVYPCTMMHRILDESRRI